jgi:hypothetical protein
MRKSVIAGLVLWTALAASAEKTHADVNYPWCIMGDTRGFECVFSSREQCMQDGRNRGFGGQCIQNPAYKPGAPTVSVKKRTVSQTARPSQDVGAAATCTGMKSACLSVSGSGCFIGGARSVASEPLPGLAYRGMVSGQYCENLCNSAWERCMKTGFWEGAARHRPAERR